MRIKYKILVIVGAVILLPMAISTAVVSVVVRQQNQQEARGIIEDALHSVEYDMQVRANRLGQSMREFTRSHDVAAALALLVAPGGGRADDAALQAAGARLATEMRKLTVGARIDEVSLHYPDGRLLASHRIEGGDGLYAAYWRTPPGAGTRILKSCLPHEDCQTVAWQREPIEEWPTLPVDTFGTPVRVVEAGSLLSLQVAGHVAAGRPAAGFVVQKRFDVAYALDLSERTLGDLAFYTARQARLIPMWNDPQLTDDFLDRLAPDAVTHATLGLESDYYAGFRTFTDPQGRLLGIVSARLPMDSTVAKTREAIVWLIGIALASVLVALPVTLFLSRRFVSPIYDLHEGAQTFAQGELSHRVPVGTQDEFGELATAFNEMADSIQRSQSQLRELNERLEAYNRDLESKIAEATRTLLVKNSQMQRDLNLAAEFQSAILPSMPRTTFLSCALRYLPYGGGVSGDVYDLSLTGSGAVNVFLGDATGHGVAAAIMTMMAQIGLDSVGRELPTDEVIRRLNGLFASRERDMSITSVFLRITPQGRLTVSNAGHPPALIVPADGSGAVELKRGGLPLGMFREEVAPFVELDYALQPGDRVFAFTDGLTEWRNPQGAEFGQERLAAFLAGSPAGPLEDTLQALLDHVQAFAAGQPCEDDLTILGFRYEPLPP